MTTNESAILLRVKKEAVKELQEQNIPISDKVLIKINSNFKKQYGLVTYHRDGWFYIELAETLFLDLDKMKDTLMHEYIHTCEGCMNHGPKWKAYADKMNRAYGYTISRVTAVSAVNNELQTAIISQKKYCLRCKKCGKEYYYIKETKTIRHPENYRCGLCQGDFESFKV